MEKFFKRLGIRLTATLLAMISFFSLFTWNPFDIIKGSATERKFESYVEFQAEAYSGALVGTGFDNVFVGSPSSSYANTYFSDMDKDEELRKIRRDWEAFHIVDEPSYAVGKLTDTERYKLVLFDAMLGGSDEKNLMSTFSDLTKEATNDCYSFAADLMEELLQETDNKNLKNQKVTTKNFNLINKIAGKSFAEDAVEAFKTVKEVSKHFENMYDLAHAYANYQTMSNMAQATESMLLSIHEDASAPHGLREAAFGLAAYFEFAYKNMLVDILGGTVSFAATTFKDKVFDVINDAWGKFLVKCGLGAAYIGIKGIRLLTNTIFDVDEELRLYYALGACVDLENALVREMQDAKSKYLKTKNYKNASYYIQTVNMYKKVVLLGMDYSIELMKHERGKWWKSSECDKIIKEIQNFKTEKSNSFLRFETKTHEAYENSQKVSYQDVKVVKNPTTTQKTTPAKEVSYDSQKIVDLAISKVNTSYANGYCLRFVRQLFEDAYGFKSTACCAYKYGSDFIDSTSRDDIPIGASVFFGGSSKICSSCKNKCGHIGIYVGDGYIVHGWSGKIVKTTIEHVVSKGYPYRGWGWHGNKALTCSNYQISSAECIETTNNSAKIVANLNGAATVQKWTYFLSKDQNQVKKVDGTQGSTHKTVSGMDCVRILDYASDPQKQSVASFTINKFNKQSLEANTTYYYKVTVKIGTKWYESSVCSFTTANILPSAPTVRVTSSSEKIGIGDQAQLIWDAADNAEYYNITVKNSKGETIQAKNSITGTTCVLNGFDSADTYTANIEAVNSAGVTEGISASFRVMPNLTVTFYDSVGQKVIDTRTVAYGHSVSAPKNPQQEGHTFSKWDKPFDRVTENITVNAIYDVNSYTVKFVDGFTGEILKSEPVEYNQSATPPLETEIEKIPEGYGFAGWDRDFKNVKSDLMVYSIYKWTDKEHSATVTINSITRNTSKKGYDVSVTVSNKVAEVSTGRVIYVLKSNGGAILATIDSSAFTLDHLSDRTIVDTIECRELASIIEVYAVNGVENNNLGQISKVATKTIDNSTSSEWSDWITYTGACPIESGNGVTVETRQLPTPDIKYYRYQTRSTTTSYNTSMSGWTQNGYSLVNAGTGSVTYVSNWHNGFLTSNTLYSQYNKTPVSAYENSTKKVVVNSNEIVGYIYWHWCRGGNHGAINRKINWTKTSTYGTFHAFFSTKKLTYSSSGNAYQYKDTACCKDTYWWNGAVSGSDNVITVYKQTYTTYNKLYNYYQYSGYSDWMEYSGDVPVKEDQSAGTNKIYKNIETKTVKGQYIYQYKYMTTDNPTIKEPTIPSSQIYTLKGNVGSQYAGKVATIWVYKYEQASNENIQYIGTTLVGSDGSINIANAKLMSAPTIESGDYTIVASVAGQAKAIKLGVLEAPKPKYTVTFYDFDGKTVLSQQSITEGESAVLPSKNTLTIPEGHRFTNWNSSVVNIRGDMKVYPECETESYVVVFVNWEKRTVDLKECLYGAELIADKAPEGKEGYITEWVVQVGNEYLTISEFREAGYTVSGNMVVETRSILEEYTVTIVDANPNALINGEQIITDGLDFVDIATEYVIANGNYIDFSSVQMSVEENPDYIFTGWINAHTGEPINSTEVKDNMILYPSYVFSETTEMPEMSIQTGEYTENISISLTSETEGATIWYTLDNSDPAISDTAIEYKEPILVDKSCVLRCYASSLGKNDSGENSGVYAINTLVNEAYHIVTVYTNIYEDEYNYPAHILARENSLFPIEVLQSVSGYTLDKIYSDESGETEFLYANQTIMQSMDVYLTYTPAIYQVNFYNYDGVIISSQEVEYLAAAIAPFPPINEGYAFVKWDKEYDCITDSIDVYPCYIPENEYAEISLNIQSDMRMRVGDTITLLANIQKNNSLEYEILWTSSDKFIATIDQYGNVTAMSAGTVTLTVKLPYTGSEATLNIEVMSDDYFGIKLKSESSMGFDAENNLRAIPLGENTVAEIRTHFENENLIFCDKNGKILNEDDLVATGTIIRLYDAEELLSATTVIVTGDFNEDGLVDNKDMVMLNQYVNKKRIADKWQLLALDINGDGLINDRDITTLSNYLVDKEIFN